MKSILPISLGLLIAAVSGWRHGLLTDRWGPPSNVLKVAEQVESLDLEIAGWDSRALGKLEGRTRKLAGAEGYFSRQYVHKDSNVWVQVTMLCGRPGPIALHSPDYCFTLAGMKQLDSESKIQISHANQEDPENFWVADYRPPESKPGPDIRTFWAWSTDGTEWSIPEDPRFTFASAPYLYRIYFSVPTTAFKPSVTGKEGPSETEMIARQFIHDFLARYSELVAKLES